MHFPWSTTAASKIQVFIDFMKILLFHLPCFMEYDCRMFSKYLVFQMENLVFQSKCIVFWLKTLDFDQIRNFETLVFDTLNLKYWVFSIHSPIYSVINIFDCPSVQLAAIIRILFIIRIRSKYKVFDRNTSISIEILGISKICDNRIPYCFTWELVSVKNKGDEFFSSIFPKI